MTEKTWPDEAWDAAHEAKWNYTGSSELDEETAIQMVIDICTALAPYVTPKSVLRDLVDRWSVPDPHERGECDSCDIIEYLRELIER